jgi:hypothetical protein
MIGWLGPVPGDARRRRPMPDKYGFNHLPDRGVISHACIECDWPLPEVRTVSEKERASHQRQHTRAHQREVEAARKQNLAAAQKAAKLKAREDAILNERFGAPSGEGGKTMTDTAIEQGQVADELEKQLKALPAKLVEKKAYHRIDQNGVTLGYVYLGVRKPSVEVPRGDGSYERVSLTTTADIPAVLSALKAVAERAAAKKAESKATPAPAAATKSRSKKSDEVKPDPKPATSRKRTKATA